MNNVFSLKAPLGKEKVVVNDKKVEEEIGVEEESEGNDTDENGSQGEGPKEESTGEDSDGDVGFQRRTWRGS